MRPYKGKGSPRARSAATECGAQATNLPIEQFGEDSTRRGTAVPLLWSLRGGVQRGERIETLPLWGFRGVGACRWHASTDLTEGEAEKKGGLL